MQKLKKSYGKKIALATLLASLAVSPSVAKAQEWNNRETMKTAELSSFQKRRLSPLVKCADYAIERLNIQETQKLGMALIEYKNQICAFPLNIDGSISGHVYMQSPRSRGYLSNESEREDINKLIRDKDTLVAFVDADGNMEVRDGEHFMVFNVNEQNAVKEGDVSSYDGFFKMISVKEDKNQQKQDQAGNKEKKALGLSSFQKRRLALLINDAERAVDCLMDSEADKMGMIVMEYNGNFYACPLKHDGTVSGRAYIQRTKDQVRGSLSKEAREDINKRIRDKDTLVAFVDADGNMEIKDGSRFLLAKVKDPNSIKEANISSHNGFFKMLENQCNKGIDLRIKNAIDKKLR